MSEKDNKEIQSIETETDKNPAGENPARQAKDPVRQMDVYYPDHDRVAAGLVPGF